MIVWGLCGLLGLGLWGLYRSLRRPAEVGAGLARGRRHLRTRLVQEIGLPPGAPPEAFLALSLLIGLVSGLLTESYLHWPLVSLLVGAAMTTLLAVLTKRRQGRRRAEVQAALVEAIGQLRSSLGASQSVQQALMDLARSSPPALRPQFRTLARDVHRIGLVPALRRFREEMADPVVNRFVDALVLNDSSGGRLLGPMLEQLARSTRAELLLQEELRAEQADTVLQARIVSALPWLLLLLFRGLNPHYLAGFDSAAGQLLLIGCAVWSVIGYVWMLWLGRLPDEQRRSR